MDRRNKVIYLLTLVGEEADNILNSTENGVDQLTAEQVIMLASQFVTTEQFNMPKFSAPIGKINPDEVMFEMTDGSCVNLRGVQYDDET